MPDGDKCYVEKVNTFREWRAAFLNRVSGKASLIGYLR